MIERRKDYVKQAPSKDARKVYIVCEGQSTEPKYFEFFEELSSNLQVVPIPSENGPDPVKLKELAEDKFFREGRLYAIDYMAHDTIWFVVDTDSWEKEGKIALLRQFCADVNSTDNDAWKIFSEAKPYAVCSVVQSNPSFEIWLYYHFYKDRPVEKETAEHPSFKDFVNSKIQGGFNFEKHPAELQNAVANSKATFETGMENNPGLFSTEVFKLGEEILRFVKVSLNRLRNKLG